MLPDVGMVKTYPKCREARDCSPRLLHGMSFLLVFGVFCQSVFHVGTVFSSEALHYPCNSTCFCGKLLKSAVSDTQH